MANIAIVQTKQSMPTPWHGGAFASDNIRGKFATNNGQLTILDKGNEKQGSKEQIVVSLAGKRC